ncbi:peroxidase [Oscillatoria sp. FACHB-1407]|uniref:peroxidase family protein n=1 Tax=Oscillatoria sp. FACHB-1407 TaxID=2692847 RepID=UPI001684CCA1|nr:heme peroxidase family protein [Oscillatoria sp. FACHB-1407]MBD2460538.1 peroxidase [Oscillatoria sp. FACHB-1407]
MPRLLHGQIITRQAFREAIDEISKRNTNPLMFTAIAPGELQDFDFLFPELQDDPANLLPESTETRNNLVRLGATMRDTTNNADKFGDSEIPAAYTYFGQFVDHDITLETTSATPAQLVDPNLKPLSLDTIQDTLKNTRTATLDLDSVYGLPAPRDPNNRSKMLVGNVTSLNGEGKPLLRPTGKGDDNDVPREPRSDDPRSDRAALTGDPRNDENLIIAQLHVAFLKAHNKLIDQGKSFSQARRILRQHYQYIVVHDFLKRIADPQIVEATLKYGNQLYNALEEPFFLPLEFTVAAYRLGHSMIRQAYDFNLNFNTSGEEGTFPATLGLLFTFTALSGQIGNTQTGETDTLPDNWIIEWENLIDAGKPFNKARRIDTKLVEPLFELPNLQGRPEPGDMSRLAVRNLLRGYLLRMPTGQAIACALQQKFPERYMPVLSSEQIELGANSQEQVQVLRETGFLERTPLWYYILVEAAALNGGLHLGPVGSTIVAEVLIGLVRRSKDSILRYRRPWKPSLPSTKPNTFTLADLLRFAEVLA